jgi:hypothetical protein
VPEIAERLLLAGARLEREREADDAEKDRVASFVLGAGALLGSAATKAAHRCASTSTSRQGPKLPFSDAVLVGDTL